MVIFDQIQKTNHTPFICNVDETLQNITNVASGIS